MNRKSERNFARNLVAASSGAEILAAILIFFLQKASFIV
jgi:hypothetical protein